MTADRDTFLAFRVTPALKSRVTSDQAREIVANALGLPVKNITIQILMTWMVRHGLDAAGVPVEEA